MRTANQLPRNNVSLVQTCRDILMKAYTFLKSEPEVLPEGKMAAEALKYVHDINTILRKNQLF